MPLRESKNSAPLHDGPDVQDAECLDDNTIVEFIDGLLSPAEIAGVESHAARCDVCRRLLAELGRAPTEEQQLGRGYSATLPAGGVAHIDLDAGQEIGRFVILSRIGKGGMGVVFSAYDPKLDRKVAIKLLHSRQEDERQSAEDAQKRLMREAQAMAQLSHPNVIQVYDVGTYKSEVYIAMEFVDGETLSRWLLRWDRSWRDVLDKFVQAGRALADAHAASLVHRDFKPDNALVGEDGRVRVMDFGLARWVLTDEGHYSSAAVPLPGLPPNPATAEADDDDDPSTLGMADTHEPVVQSHNVPSDPAVPLPSAVPTGAAKGKPGRVEIDHSLTKTGALLGTPRYMAPEQFTGAFADARSDQFSFCVALYEALYRQHPFDNSTAYGLVELPEATEVRVPPPDTKVPSWLHRALLRGMSAEANERFPSMGALLREFAPTPKPTQSSRRFFALVAVAVAAMIAAIYFYNVSDSTRSDLVEVVDENQQLELRLDELRQEVASLESQVAETLDQLAKARGHEVMVGDLEDQLKQTQLRLATTLSKLEQTQVELDKANKKLSIARRARRKSKRPAKPRLRGLRAIQIQSQINKYHRDFDVCMAEYRERRGTGEGDDDSDRVVLAVLFQIDSRGIPQRGSKTGGIDDQVVYDCVVGLLEDRLRFPASEGITIAKLGFVYEMQNLRVTVEVVEVVEDVAGENPEPAGDRPSERPSERPTEQAEPPTDS